MHTDRHGVWRSMLLSAVLAALAVPGARLVLAQPPQGPPISRDPARVQADLQAGVRLGARVASVRARLPVAPLLVIAPDERAYVDALGGWSLTRRYPVLIDDGTDGAREDIARFVRAFEPRRVLLLPPGEEPVGSIRDSAGEVVRAAWGGDGDASARAAWAAIGLTPMGVVVASETDPAWTAAVALAAGRGQPIAWVERMGDSLSGTLRADRLERLRAAIAETAASNGLAWAALGDDVDAVTLCLTLASATGGPRALTDVLPRTEAGERWAFAGLIAGSPAEAAYDAMCALFLRADRAWMFDGYPSTFAPRYQLAGVAPLFDQLGIQAELFPSSSADRWRGLTRRGLSAPLIHVNTRGQASWFDVRPGRLTSDDVPVLLEPAAVHFIHSFSARSMGSRRTIGRRWLDAGAFSYTGSVHEPMLSAFVPAEVLVRRLGGGMPIGAAMRLDAAGAWKINLFGDPLWMLVGPQPPSASTDLEVVGAVEAESALAEALQRGDYARGARLLVMLARDDDATDLAAAIDAAEDAELSPEFASQAFPAAVRTGRSDLAASLFELLPPSAQREPGAAAMLWTALSGELRADGDPLLLALMSSHVPDAEVVASAARLAPHLRAAVGGAGVRAMYDRLIAETESERTRQALRRAAGITSP